MLLSSVMAYRSLVEVLAGASTYLVTPPSSPRHHPISAIAPRRMGVICERGDRQHLADRLDPVDGAVLVDEGDHFLNGRSSSAWAKYADALRRISFAWRNSRTSRSSALIRSCSSVVGPDRLP